MTYDLQVVDRAKAGVKPRRDMVPADYAFDFRHTGTWGCGWGWVRAILEWCAPVLDFAATYDKAAWPYIPAEYEDMWQEELRATDWYKTHAYPWYAVRSSEPRTVPAFKFGSNDPWLFTPEECFILGYHLHAAPDADLKHLGDFFLWSARYGGCEAG